MNDYAFDWSKLAFGSKKPLRELEAIFVAAPRELSSRRFIQIIKKYLPQANILLGISTEPHVLGLENQPQFKMLTPEAIDSTIRKVNASNSDHKIYTLTYSQRDLTYILEKLRPRKALFINGSWYRAFHLRPEYYTLVNLKIPLEKLSPFADETEAKTYASSVKLPSLPTSGVYSEAQMLELAGQAATRSFDFGGFQTGVSLGRKNGSMFELIATTHNAVVPYETHAIHHGASRELNFSPPNDLNHYDTNHAEIELIVKAQRDHIDLRGTTLFIHLMPSPTCARMFCATDIAEFVYTADHSEGYAIKMLEAAGKTVRRVVL
jgi:tRNA(Arg) A34 adenosine deaminase TadA